jgi:hypothetical protein
MVLYLLGSSVRPVQLVHAGDGATLLINRDIVNSVLYGDRNIVAQNYSAYSVIDALGSVTVDGLSDIWAIPLAGTPTIDVVQGAAAWTPSPALVAAQINTLGLAKDTTLQTTNSNTSTTASNTATTASNVNTVNSTLGTPAQRLDVQGLTVGGTPGGVPPLRGTDNLGVAAAQTIATGVNAVLINGTSITKPSFEAVFQLNLPAAAGTVPFAILQIAWQDSNTGLQVGLKQYVLTAGNGTANILTYYISGPCRGNQIVLKLRNQDPAQTLTVTWAFNQTSHVYLSDRLLQAVYAGTAPITFTNPNGNPSKGLLFSSSPSVGPNANTIRLCACSNAKVKISVDNTVQLNSCAVQINTPSSTALYEEAAAPTTLLKLTAAAGAQTFTEWQMPGGATAIQIFNQGATNTIQPNVAITVMEY